MKFQTINLNEVFENPATYCLCSSQHENLCCTVLAIQLCESSKEHSFIRFKSRGKQTITNPEYHSKGLLRNEDEVLSILWINIENFIKI